MSATLAISGQNNAKLVLRNVGGGELVLSGAQARASGMLVLAQVTGLASGGGGSGGGLSNGDHGDILVSDDGDTLTIDSKAVTLAKMADLAASSIIGNVSGVAATPVAVSRAALVPWLAIQASEVGFTPVGALAATTVAGALAELDSEKLAVAGGTIANLTVTSSFSYGGTGVTITAANLNTLDDGVDSTLHFHASDRARANHTGAQLAATISDFAATVIATVLTGFAAAGSRTAIAATDTILAAFGKVQKYLNDLSALAFSGSGADLTAGSVTYAKVQNVSATSRFLGRVTAGAGSMEEVTPTQATALLDLASGSLKGLMSAADFTKLGTVASGATANSSDAALLARANHTGQQTASTISDFSTAADARIAAASIDTLSDVQVTSPATGQVLKWNGSLWTNQADATGGGSGVTDGDYGDVNITGTGTVFSVESIAGGLELKGIISPAQITAQQDNYAPASLATSTVLRLSTDNDSRALTGLTAQNAGALRIIENIGSYDLLLYHEHASSTAANRFDTGGPAVVIAKGGVAFLKYDGTTSRWRVLSVRGDGQSRAGNRRQTTFFADFLAAATTANPPFIGAAISSGTSPANTTSDGNHQGIVNLSSSTTANSGYRWQTDAGSIGLRGGEVFECVFYVASLTTTTTRMGFHDATTVTDAVDGAYIELPASSGAAVLKTSNNSTRTTSATIATLATSNWYRAVITVNRDATSVAGELFDSNGVSLGSQSNTTNIPTTAGRETQAGIVHTNSGTAAIVGIALDYIAYRNGEGRPALR